VFNSLECFLCLYLLNKQIKQAPAVRNCLLLITRGVCRMVVLEKNNLLRFHNWRFVEICYLSRGICRPLVVPQNWVIVIVKIARNSFRLELATLHRTHSRETRARENGSIREMCGKNGWEMGRKKENEKLLSPALAMRRVCLHLLLLAYAC